MDEGPTRGPTPVPTPDRKVLPPGVFVPMWNCSPLFPRHSQIQTGTRDAVTVTAGVAFFNGSCSAYSRSLSPPPLVH